MRQLTTNIESDEIRACLPFAPVPADSLVAEAVRDGSSLEACWGGMLLQLRAGWDIPGGHVEPGQAPAEAMVREVLQETGVNARPLAVVGLQSIRVDGDPPPNYRYSLPESFQVFFSAVAVDVREFLPTAEASDSRFISLTEAVLPKVAPSGDRTTRR